MAISAAAAVTLVAGLFSLGRGGHDSPGAQLTAEAASATAPVPHDLRAPTARGSAGGGARLTASHGPYGDPFDLPAHVAAGTASTGKGPGQPTGAQGASPTAAASPSPSVEAMAASPVPSSGGSVDVADTGASPPSGNESPASPPSGNESPASPPSGDESPASPPSSGPGDAPAVMPSVTSSMPRTDPVATLRLVVPGHEPQVATLGAQGVFPSRANPLLAVLHVIPGRGRAVFMPAVDVRPEGHSRCSPSVDRCRRLTLTVGQVQLLEATSKAGQPVRYRLRLMSVG